MFAADPKTLNRIAPSIRRIVIADPNPASARLLMDIMKVIGSREVFIESDEERALELLRDVEPGMVFTERRGETLNGETLTRRLRRSSMICRTAPVIMVTSDATASSIKGARDAGVHEFLRKPFTAGDLFKRIENVALKARPWIEAVGYVGPDRRRFNSGEYAGARKRKADAASNETTIDPKTQALRILAAALAQFNQDPMQAARAVKQQVDTLKALAASTGDINLAIAANGLDAYLSGGGVTKDGLAQPIGAILALSAPVPQTRAG
ncbi:two-component system response regulator [Brevundimonas sp. PAMC22021]|uniref:response regulator n=1 Tax=Brevundimonas sp. PAMC22021 TaxID=2861285 RepID=UPI001C63659F|nr:response regulator [Brevundimonas sp. PAMC22021]QYF86020.1 response regulator [Brevundimonas sp. PAMC22021]